MEKNILDRIVDVKKSQIAAAAKKISEGDLRRGASGKRSKRPFFQNLAAPGESGVNIIAEIKRASPSKGDIRMDLNPARYAAAYEAGGAKAVSVLTDAPFFGGSLEDLQQARGATGLPVLRKDFIVSSYQIYEALAAGADAVLLIVRILEKQQLKDYVDLCREIDMDTLVEVHHEKDIEAAADAGAGLIGINNRDLRSFDTDIGTAGRLASLLEPGQVPVAASGISSKDDVDQTVRQGIFNFLIGESLVRAENPAAFLRSLV